MAKLKDEQSIRATDDDELLEKTPVYTDSDYEDEKANAPIDVDSADDDDEEPEVDASRSNPAPPSSWKRTALFALILFVFYYGFKIRAALLRERKPQVIHASRYSNQYKFRPAASPIITEVLKDGRTRLRGAHVTPTATPTPSKPAARKRSTTARKAKRKSTGA